MVNINVNAFASARAEHVITSFGSTDNTLTSQGLAVNCVVEGGALKAGMDTRYVDFEASALHAKANLEFDLPRASVKAGAIAEAGGATADLKIPIFWTGYDFVVTGELSLFGIGAEYQVDVPNRRVGGKVSVGVGAGIYLGVEKSN